MAALIPLLPYLLKALAAFGFVLGLIAVYFGIQHKGALKERAKQEAKQEQVKQQVQLQVNKAVSQDATIDKKITVEVQKIEEANKTVVPSGPDKFRF